MKSQPDLLGAMDFIEELEKNPEGVSKLPKDKTVLWLTIYMESFTHNLLTKETVKYIVKNTNSLCLVRKMG